MADEIEILWARSHSLSSLAIRAINWSAWSHCALVTPGGVIESVWPAGVVVTVRERFEARSSRLASSSVAVPDARAALAFARAQVGRPYDLAGALGLGLHREWDDPSRWWCSELIAAALRAGGRTVFPRNQHRVTPEHLWMALGRSD